MNKHKTQHKIYKDRKTKENEANKERKKETTNELNK